MILKRAFFGLVLSAQFLVTPSALQAASETQRLKIIYSSFTGAYAPLWIAIDEGLGEKMVWISKPSMPAEQGLTSCC